MVVGYHHFWKHPYRVVVSKIFIFTQKIGEMIQSDYRIFFKWVGEKPPTSNVLLFFIMVKLLMVQISGDHQLVDMVKIAHYF